MSEPRQAFGAIHFGPFELSTASSELRKHGQRLKLSGQAIDVLLMLASNAGRLVTREDLQRRLWAGDSFGDFEHGLNAAVNRLRETLGDSATSRRFLGAVTASLRGWITCPIQRSRFRSRMGPSRLISTPQTSAGITTRQSGIRMPATRVQ